MAGLSLVLMLGTGVCGSSTSGAGRVSSLDTSATGHEDTTGAAGDRTAPTADVGTLPQTRDRPSVDDAHFESLGRAFWNAIVDDRPDLAMPSFFPLSAYLQVKDIHDPGADWRDRLVAAFNRDIHRLHGRLGGSGASATLISLDVPSARATWVNPGDEYNKVGYWRVYGSSLRYQVAGVTYSMPIYSLISWRGEWYVVHVGPPS